MTIRSSKQAVALTGHREKGFDPNDFFRTPEMCTEALLEVEEFGGGIWECACGDGAMSSVLERRYAGVVSTDLVDRGYGRGGVDFLAEKKLRAPNIVTNPPFKLATPFMRHAVGLGADKVALFLRLACLEGQTRGRFFKAHPPARVWVFSARVPRMHRPDYDGKREERGQTAFAWFVWTKGHRGPPALGWL